MAERGHDKERPISIHVWMGRPAEAAEIIMLASHFCDALIGDALRHL
jgi:hypothetical protein